MYARGRSPAAQETKADMRRHITRADETSYVCHMHIPLRLHARSSKNDSWRRRSWVLTPERALQSESGLHLCTMTKQEHGHILHDPHSYDPINAAASSSASALQLSGSYEYESCRM